MRSPIEPLVGFHSVPDHSRLSRAYFSCSERMHYGPTDRSTDRRTDRRTDKAPYRDAGTHLKTYLCPIIIFSKSVYFVELYPNQEVFGVKDSLIMGQRNVLWGQPICPPLVISAVSSNPTIASSTTEHFTNATFDIAECTGCRMYWDLRGKTGHVLLVEKDADTRCLFRPKPAVPILHSSPKHARTMAILA